MDEDATYARHYFAPNQKRQNEPVNPTDAATLPTEEPLVINRPDDADWDMACDLLVVGLGAAGASAAIHAKEAGADVLVVDRFGMGGATAKSGGVVYGGGGTRTQRKLGIEDTPEAMFNYLRLEAGDAVSEVTLRRFCNDSTGLIEWLESIGVSFDSDDEPPKTSYPKNGIYLYYSGNEAILPYAEAAPPAPRGHRVVCEGLSGKKLFSHLNARVAALQIPVHNQCAVRRLITDADGAVIGARAWRLPPASAAARRHEKLIRWADFIHNIMPGMADRLRARAARIEQNEAEPLNIRAHNGVLLTTGGFIFNREMVAEHAPRYLPNMRLGTTGCEGSGIRLGLSAGGVAERMHKASAWRFINPPQPWVKGAVVNRQGKRFCNEMSYGARLGVQICEEQDGKAWLILDAKLRKASMREALYGGLWSFQKGPALLLMWFAKRGRSIVDLAHKLDLPAETLNAEIHAYNRVAEEGGSDALGKTADKMQPLRQPPYYAIDISTHGNPLFPCPTITLGGLKVDETSGAVMGTEGQAIPGLYAAGRAAVGVASNGYVSGLSLADCLWSGRRAGLAVATPAETEHKSEDDIPQKVSLRGTK